MKSTTIPFSQDIDDLNVGDFDGDIDGMDKNKLFFSEDQQQKLLEVFPNKNKQDLLPHQVQQQQQQKFQNNGNFYMQNLVQSQIFDKTHQQQNNYNQQCYPDDLCQGNHMQYSYGK